MMKKNIVFLVCFSTFLLSTILAVDMMASVSGTEGITEPQYVRIADYYDNRKSVVTVTADDWWNRSWQEFEDMGKMLTEKRIYYTGAIITDTDWSPPNWTQIQYWLNQGYAEAASHSRSHPDEVPYSDYESEINGGKQDILDNLNLPTMFSFNGNEYVYAWSEPYNTSDSTIRQILGECKYLADRMVSIDDDEWAKWDSANGLFDRIGYSIRMESTVYGVDNVTELNSKFDSVYSSGGIYHLMTHPADAYWEPEKYADLHTDYISNRTDVWYVNFGLLYLYHWIDTQNIVQVTSTGSLQKKVFKIAISSTDRQDFGAKYPVTYVFDVPSSWTNGYVNYRFRETDSWTTMETKTSSDFFNGINAVRFDFSNHKAYVSIGFNDTSNEIYLQILPQDDIPPVTANDYYDQWHTTDFTINLNATDDVIGVAETYYKINDDSTKSVGADGQPFITEEGAENKLEYWSVDNADNEELHKVLTGIKLDKTAPIGSITIKNNDTYATSTSVTLNLTATDEVSGIYQVRFSNDGLWDTEPWEDFSTTKAWTLTSGDGPKTVYYQIKDNAGLVSNTYSDTIILDTTSPAANAGPDQVVDEDTPMTFDGSASYDNIGIINYTWTFFDETPQTLTGMNPTYTFNTPGNYTVTLSVTDAALNSATDTVVITVIDTTKSTTKPTTFPLIAVLNVAIIAFIIFLSVLIARKLWR